MGVIKITDKCYYGTHEEIKALLLGGAEKDSYYCDIDSGAVYKGVVTDLGKSESDGAPIVLQCRGIINRERGAKPIINTLDLASEFIKADTHILKGKKIKINQIIENLLVKNNTFTDTDEANGYTRIGGAITFTNEQTSAIVKSLNVYADDVEKLAIVVRNEDDTNSVSSGAIKVGYIDSTNTFIEIKSVEAIAASGSVVYRDVIIEGAEVVPHCKLALQLNSSVSAISVLVADEKFATPYGDNELDALATNDAIDNIVAKGTLDDGMFSDVEFAFNMRVLKDTSAEKFINIEDNTYSDTANDAKELIADDDNWYHFGGQENVTDSTASDAGAIFGIAEVLN